MASEFEKWDAKEFPENETTTPTHAALREHRRVGWEAATRQAQERVGIIFASEAVAFAAGHQAGVVDVVEQIREALIGNGGGGTLTSMDISRTLDRFVALSKSKEE